MKNAKNCFDCNYNFGVTSNFGCLSTKRNLRADGLSLLPSALRPRLVGVFVVLVFSIIGSLLMQNSYVSEASAVSLTLTVPSAPLSVNLNPNTDNGFAKSTDGNISVSTAANWGFQLSVQAKDSNALKNGSNSLTSITTSIDEATFKSNADYVNKWGFKPSKLNNAANSNFVAGPTTSPTIIEKTSASSASASQYTIAIGAKANSTLATGTYSNNFTFTAVANTVSYTINYNLNSGSWSGTSPQSGSTTERTVTLDSHSPTRSNYTFEGWCTVQPTNNDSSNPTCSGSKYSAGNTYTLSNGTNSVNLYAMWKSTSRSYTINYTSNISGASSIPSAQSGSISSPYNVTLSSNTPTLSGYIFKGWCTSSTSTTSCSGSTYQPGNSYTVNSNGLNITLYAMWQQIPAAVNKGSLGTMQNFSCSSKLPSIHNYGTVTDSRDNNTYKVAKLMDGKCWMIDNLKIVGRSISSSNSDMTSGSFTIPASNLTTFKNGSSDDNNNAAYVDNTYGGDYTWNVATAGTGASATSRGANATGSICPKGWKLPSSGSSSSGDFAELVTAYGGANSTGSTNLRTTPVPGFTYAGYVYYNNGSLSLQGSHGYYWSSTSYNSTDAYNLYLVGSSARPVDFNHRVSGYSVRCVAR